MVHDGLLLVARDYYSYFDSSVYAINIGDCRILLTNSIQLRGSGHKSRWLLVKVASIAKYWPVHACYQLFVVETVDGTARTEGRESRSSRTP